MGEADRMLESAWADLSLAVKAWSAEAKLRDGLQTWLQGPLAWCEDAAFATRFHSACPVEGVSPDDYLQRILQTPSGARILVGIRFPGGAGDFPFVDLLASTQSLHPPGALADAMEAIWAPYAKFAPRAVRILRSTDAPSLDVLPFSIEVDQVLLAGRVGTIAASDPPRHCDRVVFELVEDTAEAAAFVADAYADFFDRHPEMKGIVHPAGEDELAPCHRVHCLGYAVIDGQRAGLIGAAPCTKYTLEGYEVIEEVLTAAWRGQGLAVALQRTMIDHLASTEPDVVLFGTIAGVNRASQATALRVGRQKVASFLFVSSP
jgi:GNAT superfamily N-acetyltransferase